MCYFDIIFFFFSSRRRHTRLVSDWSSDVCSSDLPRPTSAWPQSAGAPGPLRKREARQVRLRDRSEERRVGKECRSRWSRDPKKNKKKLECRRSCEAKQYMNTEVIEVARSVAVRSQ